MVDQKKRHTLKTLVTTTAWATVPATVGTAAAVMADVPASSAAPTKGYVTYHIDEASAQFAGRTGLDIEVEKTTAYGKTWVRFANLSDRPVTVRQISQGLVRSEGKLYDVNTVLDGEGLIIEARQACSFMIEPVSTVETALTKPAGSISPITASLRGQDPLRPGDILTPRLVLA